MKVQKIIWFTFASILMCSYIIYHSAMGQRGLFSMWDLEKELLGLQKELEEIRFERIIVDQKVANLRDNSLDLDLVEQQAKSVLGYAHKDEEVIFHE